MLAPVIFSKTVWIPDGQSDDGNPYLFTGRRVDILDNGSLKIQYNRNRYYDYYTGRWLTQDPAGYTDGMNLYEYVGSASSIRTDPLGKFSPSLHGPITQEGYDDSVVTFSFLVEDFVLSEVKKWNKLTDFDLFGIDSYHCGNVSFVNKVKGYMDNIKAQECDMGRIGPLSYGGFYIVKSTGRILHNLQDCMSHTDWCEGCEGRNTDMRDLYWAVHTKTTNDRYDFDRVSDAAASEALVFWVQSIGNVPYHGIPMDLSLLEAGSSAEVSGRIYYPDIGASGSHGLYAADHDEHGRTKWKEGSSDPYVHFAWEHAYDTAVLQTKDFFEWLEQNVTFCCWCELYGY
jgi:RHS repeat-associated protein